MCILKDKSWAQAISRNIFSFFFFFLRKNYVYIFMNTMKYHQGQDRMIHSGKKSLPYNLCFCGTLGAFFKLPHYLRSVRYPEWSQDETQKTKEKKDSTRREPKICSSREKTINTGREPKKWCPYREMQWLPHWKATSQCYDRSKAHRTMLQVMSV